MKIFVLTYAENTDVGDPVYSIATSLYLSREEARAVMMDSYQKVDAIMHYEDMQKDDEHEVSKTDDSIFVRNGIDSVRWFIEEKELHGTEPLTEPMSPSEALEMQEKSGSVTANISISKGCLGWDQEELLDAIADRLVEGGCVTDISVNLIAVDGDTVVFAALAHVEQGCLD